MKNRRIETHETIIIPSLGRTACLGDIYDARREKFIYLNVFNKTVPPDIIDKLVNDNLVSDFVMSSKSSDKISKLNIEGELKLNILCGVVQVGSGSARFINEQKSCHQAVQCSFIQNITTIDECINFGHEALEDCFSTNIGDDGTHVVYKISWGANVAVTFTYDNNESRSRDDIMGELRFGLEKLKTATAKGSTSWESSKIFSSQQLKLNVYADVMSNEEGAPRNLDEAMNLIYNMPKRVRQAGDGKGKMLLFHLIPLSVMKKHLGFKFGADTMLNSIDATIMKKLEHLFEEIEDFQIDLNELSTKMSKFPGLITDIEKNRFEEFQFNFDVTVSQFRSSLAETMHDVRSGQTSASHLDDLYSKYKTNDYLDKTKFNDFTRSFKQPLETINIIQEVTKDGATYISTEHEFSLYKLHNNKFYLLCVSLVDNGLDFLLRHNYFLKKSNRVVILDVDKVQQIGQIIAHESVKNQKFKYSNGKYYTFDRRKFTIADIAIVILNGFEHQFYCNSEHEKVIEKKKNEINANSSNDNIRKIVGEYLFDRLIVPINKSFEESSQSDVQLTYNLSEQFVLARKGKESNWDSFDLDNASFVFGQDIETQFTGFRDYTTFVFDFENGEKLIVVDKILFKTIFTKPL